MKRFLPFAVLMVAAACSDQAAPFAPTAESESVLMASRIAAANASKVDVCHVDGKGNYRLINVSAAAVKAHDAHGDGRPDEKGLGPDCSVAVDPFRFDPLSLDPYDNFSSYIVWTVQGTPSPASFDVQLRVIWGVDTSWVSQEDAGVFDEVSGSYSSLHPWGAGETYRIEATFAIGTPKYSDPIEIVTTIIP